MLTSLFTTLPILGIIVCNRGASGCLIFSFAENADNGDEERSCQITRSLIDAMQSSSSTKTYLALCDGDGTCNSVDYRDKGWFTIDKPVKDEYGKSSFYYNSSCYGAID